MQCNEQIHSFTNTGCYFSWISMYTSIKQITFEEGHRKERSMGKNLLHVNATHVPAGSNQRGALELGRTSSFLHRYTVTHKTQTNVSHTVVKSHTTVTAARRKQQAKWWRERLQLLLLNQQNVFWLNSKTSIKMRFPDSSVRPKPPENLTVTDRVPGKLTWNSFVLDNIESFKHLQCLSHWKLHRGVKKMFIDGLRDCNHRHYLSSGCRSSHWGTIPRDAWL